MPPLILITNDDGIHSPGLHATVSALHELGDLLIVAPTEQQSAMSRSLPSGFDGRIFPCELSHNGHRWNAFHLAGSPAMAVIYGVMELASRRPDLVVSGINYGENLGSNTMISGTVGAALQGGDMGIPSLAVSLETHKEYHYTHGSDVHWDVAAHWLRYFADKTLARSAWPADVAALKIDVPDSATTNTAWRITTQSKQSYYVSRSTAERQQPQDPCVLDYEVYIDYDHLEKDSDIFAFTVERIISVTPLSVNLTARGSIGSFETVLRSAGR